MSDISNNTLEDSHIAFVPWKPEIAAPQRKTGTRTFHKKSRNGCQSCKARRVKCNEEHPVCGNCQKYKATCVWTSTPEDTGGHKVRCEGTESKTYNLTIRSNPSQCRKPLELPETRTRRLLELRLFHHYMTVTAATFGGPESTRLSDWLEVVPPMAFEHESLLHSIFAVTCLHLSYIHPDQPEHLKNYQDYYGIALHSHRDAVTNLNANNADAAMVTATVLRIGSVSSLQRREIFEFGEYNPPLEWLIMNHGTGHGLGLATWKFLKHDQNSLLLKWMSVDAPMLDLSNPYLRNKGIFTQSNLTPILAQTLVRTSEDEIEEPWDEDIQEAYEHAAAYVGACQSAVQMGEAGAIIMRRLVMLPVIIEREYIRLVEEKRGRALVILAHHFEIWRLFSNIWWFGESGVRETRAIAEVVSPRWKALLP